MYPCGAIHDISFSNDSFSFSIKLSQLTSTCSLFTVYVIVILSK